MSIFTTRPAQAITVPTPAETRRRLRLALVAASGVLAMGLNAPQPAWAADVDRAVTGYHAVALEAPVKAQVVLAERESVRLSGDEKALENLETLVQTRHGVPTLIVRQKSGSGAWSLRPWSALKSDPTLTVIIQGPRFEALSVTGSGDLEARLSNQPGLKLALAGSGDLNVKGLTAHQVEVNVAGSGDVRVQGAAQNLSVNVAGSGDAWLTDLEAEDVKVSVAGSGDVRVNARQRLRVSIAGSGDVRYQGPAREVSSSVMGSGTVARESPPAR